MATISEDYVSFETAKLLKEKGFSENTIYKYADVGGITEKWYDDYRERVLRFDWGEGYLIEPPIEPKDQYEIIGDTISAPTLQMAMKWLRIEHNIHIEPHIVKTRNSYGYMPNYIDLKELKQHFPFDEFDFSNADKYACITYDKACEVAIKYCLEHLI